MDTTSLLAQNTVFSVNKTSVSSQCLTKNWLTTAIGILTSLVWLLSACSASSSPTAYADVYEGTQIDDIAPDFHLTNQGDESVALSDFRGKVVALTFMESRCEDTCPLTAVELRRVSQALGDETNAVVFIGVNVNAQANAVADVAAATQEWHLDEIPTWHFLTGNPAELEAVWQSYGIEVLPPVDESSDLSHSPGIYLIDQTGQRRWYVSTPFVGPNTPAPSRPLNELLTMRIRQLLSET
jgi:protein SCO1/2